MRNKYNQGDKVKFKGGTYEIEEVRIYSMEEVRYLIKGDEGVVFMVNQEELEEELDE